MRAGLNDAKQNRDRNHDLMKGTKQTFDWMGGFRSSFIIE